ncbi:Uncharacterised protein [Vibrio cholerae]|nr:Uncharacterised protein [Vibrio cholerae]
MLLQPQTSQLHHVLPVHSALQLPRSQHSLQSDDVGFHGCLSGRNHPYPALCKTVQE